MPTARVKLALGCNALLLLALQNALDFLSFVFRNLAILQLCMLQMLTQVQY